MSLLYVVLCLLLVNGCKSTDNSNEVEECETEKPQNCDSSDEADRGYDPCLVNQKLPVCNTE